MNIRKKGKYLKRKFGNFIRNEDHSMLISRNTNIRVFPKTIVCGPWQGRRQKIFQGGAIRINLVSTTKNGTIFEIWEV